MEKEELIESGTLELFIFGLLTEEENIAVQEMAQQHPEVQAEILSIEQAVINLSYSISPKLSAENYHKIKQILLERQGGEVVELQPKKTISPYLGWAAAVILMFGISVQYYNYNEVKDEAKKVTVERNQYEQMLADAQRQNIQTEEALAIVRDKADKTITLEGQQVAPDAKAKIYLNKANNETYVDIAGLPTPPKGKVYQVWALKLSPLTPTSIGVLDTDNIADTKGIYKVDSFEGAEAFGITLEPEGGSESPTLEQLYTLGKV